MKSFFSNLSQAQAMLLVGIITVIIGGAITGYFKIRETQIPIEATLTAEIKQEIKLTIESKQTVQAKLTATSQIATLPTFTPTMPSPTTEPTSAIKTTPTPTDTSTLELARTNTVTSASISNLTPSPIIAVTSTPTETASPKPETTESTPIQLATSSPSPVFTPTPTMPSPTPTEPSEDDQYYQTIYDANEQLVGVLEDPPSVEVINKLLDTLKNTSSDKSGEKEYFLGYWCGQDAQTKVLTFVKKFQLSKFPEGITSITFGYDKDKNFKISSSSLQTITVETQENWGFSSAEKTRCSIATYTYELIPEGKFSPYCINSYDFKLQNFTSVTPPDSTKCPF